MMTAEAAAERAGGDAAGSETGEEVALRREQQMVKRARVNAALREKANLDQAIRITDAYSSNIFSLSPAPQPGPRSKRRLPPCKNLVKL